MLVSYGFLEIMTIFFFNDTATTEIYTLSLHDALPISHLVGDDQHGHALAGEVGHHLQHLADHLRVERGGGLVEEHDLDRKSTRLNSSHANISYAVFCLKKKKSTRKHRRSQENKS